MTNNAHSFLLACGKMRFQLVFFFQFERIPSDNYMLKVNNRNTTIRCEVYSKSTKKTPERSVASVFIANLEHIPHLVLVFLLLTLNR